MTPHRLTAIVHRNLVDSRFEGTAGGLGAAAVVVVATLLRFALNPWVFGVPFLTYFPAVLIAGLLFGWRWGAFALFAAAAAANYMFQPPFMAFALTQQQVVSTFSFLLFGGLTLATTEALRLAVAELDRRAIRERELNLELMHRVNNNLAVIQGLARQTQRVSASPEAFYEAFSGRIMALSEAHKVLTASGLEMTKVAELVEAAIRPFRTSGEILAGGPSCTVPIAASTALVLALHELGTNATKYGALSVPAGKVTVSWRLEGRICHLEWCERGGPLVSPPTRQGLGARLLRAQPGVQSIVVTFESQGVECDIAIPGAAPVGSEGSNRSNDPEKLDEAVPVLSA